jgi:hypothetical protein
MAKDLTKAVVRVGHGRGFVVEHRHSRVVITASHCLPTDSNGRLLRHRRILGLTYTRRHFKNCSDH